MRELTGDTPYPTQKGSRAAVKRQRTANGRVIKRTPIEYQPDSKPDEVSDFLWDMAGRWIEKGTKKLGRRPKVKQSKLAIRWHNHVNGDANPEAKKLLRRLPNRPDIREICFVHMIEKFWELLLAEEYDANHQMLFFDPDFWPDLVDRSVVYANLQVWKDQGSPLKKTKPLARNTEYEELIRKQRQAAWCKANAEAVWTPPLTTEQRQRVADWHARRTEERKMEQRKSSDDA